MTNIFVLGLEPFNRRLLERLPKASRYRFIGLLGFDEAVRPASGHIDLPALLKEAEDQLATFDGPVDAVIGFWDFPTSVLAPILHTRRGRPGPTLEAVATCEHKYWSRLQQQRATPQLVPRFEAVDPFAEDPLGGLGIGFPFWLKPVKAHSSYLGFRIDDAQDFNACLPMVRERIGHFGRPFDDFLSMVDVPPEVAGIGGSHMIAEEIISAGEQCTLEGFAFRGEVEVYGVVDSVRAGRHRSSFSRYQYPSRLPSAVQARMIDAARRIIRQIGYDGAPFNMEFYWNPDNDAIRILEVNDRISKSHCPLFEMVDGQSHQQVAIDLALGERPQPPRGEGRHAVAGKFMERVFTNGVVERVPGSADIERFHARFPDGMVRIIVQDGQRLSRLQYQDSYSFEVAEVFLGAETEEALLSAHREAMELLPFRISPTVPAAA
jgi:biotin carboxylase